MANENSFRTDNIFAWRAINFVLLKVVRVSLYDAALLEAD